MFELADLGLNFHRAKSILPPALVAYKWLLQGVHTMILLPNSLKKEMFWYTTIDSLFFNRCRHSVEPKNYATNHLRL